jgi:hypothetical protein
MVFCTPLAYAMPHMAQARTRVTMSATRAVPKHELLREAPDGDLNEAAAADSKDDRASIAS